MLLDERVDLVVFLHLKRLRGVSLFETFGLVEEPDGA